MVAGLPADLKISYGLANASKVIRYTKWLSGGIAREGFVCLLLDNAVTQQKPAPVFFPDTEPSPVCLVLVHIKFMLLC